MHAAYLNQARNPDTAAITTNLGTVFFTTVCAPEITSTFRHLFPNLKRYDRANTIPQECHDAVDACLARFAMDPTGFSPDEQLSYLLTALPVLEWPSFGRDPHEKPLRRCLGKSIQHRYRGDAADRLLSFVIKVNHTLFRNKTEGKRPSFRGTAIVQSSGTGKTRMVHELGQKAPLLYVCIRRSDTARSGFPLADRPFVHLACMAFLRAPTSVSTHRQLSSWQPGFPRCLRNWKIFQTEKRRPPISSVSTLVERKKIDKSVTASSTQWKAGRTL